MRAGRWSQTLDGPIAVAIAMAAAVAGLHPALARGSNLVVRGVAGAGGTTCGLVDGQRASAGLAVTCGNGNGRTLNAIYMNSSGTVHQGASAQAWIDAPPGVLIDTVSVNYCSNMNGGSGWGGGSFWGPNTQYGKEWSPATCSSHSTGQWSDYPEGVPRYGFQLICGQTNCSNGYVYVPSFSLSATETAQPSLIAVGAENIWYQGGRWLWNPPSDPWSAALVGSDATGVCRYQWSIGGQSVGQSYPQNDTTWQQCPNHTTWNTSVDTAAYPNGQLTYEVQDWNAAGVATSDSETLDIDNQTPSVSLVAAPSRGSAVTFDVHAVAGPSGLAGVSCADNGDPLPIEAGTVTVSRTGAHRVDCQAVNNAVDPQGEHNTGSAAAVVQIATSRIPLLARRRAHGHVNVAVAIRWSWSGRQTVLRRITIMRLPRHARVGLTCAGRGCPWRRLSAPWRSVGRLKGRLAGSHFRSGDVLTLTIAVPGRISERARLKIRDGHKPSVRRLS